MDILPSFRGRTLGPIVAGAALIVYSPVSGEAQNSSPPAKNTVTATNSVTAIINKFQAKQHAVFEKAANLKTDEERQKVYQELPPAQATAVELLEALKQPQPDELSGFQWIFRQSHGLNEETYQKAVDLFTSRHLTNQDVHEIPSTLIYTAPKHRKASEELLTKLYEQNPGRKVKGIALMALAYVQREKVGMAHYISQNPEDAKRHYGEELVKAYRGQSVEKLEKAAEEMFEKAAKNFGDVPFSRGTLAEQAQRDLFEMRNLVVGKVAPEIEGKDQDDKPMKLSEFRGKVVVIDFWGDW